jgi:hypothetical protein
MRGAAAIWLAGILILALNGCVSRAQPTRGRVIGGTCESTCNRYRQCKHGLSEEQLASCVSDCRLIFSEDGETDQSALRQLESLECRDLVAYIDGDSQKS